MERTDSEDEKNMRKHRDQVYNNVFIKSSHLNKFTRLKKQCRLIGESEPRFKRCKETSLGCKKLIRPALNVEARFSPHSQIFLSWRVIDNDIGMGFSPGQINPFIDKYIIFGRREDINKNEFSVIGEIDPEPRFPMKITLTDFEKGVAYYFSIQIKYKDKTLSSLSNTERLML